MAAPNAGTLLKIQARPDNIVTKILVNSVSRYAKRGSRPTTRTAVFQRATPLTLGGVREQSFTLTGILNPTDAGQLVLFTAEEGNVSCFVTVQPDGTNGFEQEVEITSNGHDADPDAWQEITFECTGVGPRVIVGAGPINI